MEKRETSILVLSNLVVLLLFSTCFSLQAAEEKQISGKDTYERTIAKTDIFPTDVPHHHMVQQVNVFTTESNDQDFNNLRVTMYEQVDSVKQNGNHKGYRIQRHENGDDTYVRYEGSHFVSEEKGGAYRSHFEGKWEVTGGTGKFKHIKGDGTYKGTGTEEGAILNWTGEVEY